MESREAFSFSMKEIKGFLSEFDHSSPFVMRNEVSVILYTACTGRYLVNNKSNSRGA